MVLDNRTEVGAVARVASIALSPGGGDKKSVLANIADGAVTSVPPIGEFGRGIGRRNLDNCEEDKALNAWTGMEVAVQETRTDFGSNGSTAARVAASVGLVTRTVFWSSACVGTTVLFVEIKGIDPEFTGVEIDSVSVLPMGVEEESPTTPGDGARTIGNAGGEIKWSWLPNQVTLFRAMASSAESTTPSRLKS